MKQGKPLAGLSLAELRAAHAGLDESAQQVLGAANAVAAMQSAGSTNPKEVAMQVDRWKERLHDANPTQFAEQL
jgi:argininosuccinate lyase